MAWYIYYDSSADAGTYWWIGPTMSNPVSTAYYCHLSDTTEPSANGWQKVTAQLVNLLGTNPAPTLEAIWCGIQNSSSSSSSSSSSIGLTSSSSSNGGGGGQTGACCVTGTCYAGKTVAECEGLEGVFQGYGTVCDPDPCNGACCSGEECAVTDEVGCGDVGGVWKGDGTDCDPNPCIEPVACQCVIGQFWVCNPEPWGHCAGWQYDSSFLQGCWDSVGGQNMCGDIGGYTPGGGGCTEGGSCWTWGVMSDDQNCSAECASLWDDPPPGPPGAPCTPCGTCCGIPVGEPCQTSLWESECDTLGGTWYEDSRPCEECP